MNLNIAYSGSSKSRVVNPGIDPAVNGAYEIKAGVIRRVERAQKGERVARRCGAWHPI